MPEKTKIVFVYSGYEQGTWGDIAFRREQYYHFLPGILYLAAALRLDDNTAAGLDVTTRHYNTTVQTPDEIRDELVELKPDCIGFACYCWNIELHKRLASEIREHIPDVKVIFGGPEIMMYKQEQCLLFFEQCPQVDLLIFGEAETRIAALTHALVTENFADISGLGGFAFHPRFGDHISTEVSTVPELRNVPVIYPHSIEVKHSPHAGIHVVYEASRGCPNKCIYCEFTRWRTQQEPFPLQRIESDLKWLLEREVDGIHFADAVFDKDPEVTARILDLLVRHNRRSTLLCYCSFNTLNARLAELYDKSQIQIGVGVQSTNPEVLRAIRRFQPLRLFHEAPAICAPYSINFYIDLMFGLPRDNMQSFRKSFDDALRLGPAFMMLFPLTLIRGTHLGNEPEHYNVHRYSDTEIKPLDLQCDIEYTNIGLSDGFALKELEIFDDVAISCFYYYNRFPHALRHLEKRWEGSAFDLYRTLGRETKRFLSRTRQTASNTATLEGFQEEIQRVFRDVLVSRNAGRCELVAFEELFKLDLFRLVVLRSPNREKIYRQTLSARPVLHLPSRLEPSNRLIKTTFGKTITLKYPLSDLQHLHELRENITPYQSSVYVHAPFGRANTSIRQVDAMESFLIELLATDRGLRVKSILTSLDRQFGRGDGSETLTKEDIGSLCAPFVQSGALGILG